MSEVTLHEIRNEHTLEFRKCFVFRLRKSSQTGTLQGFLCVSQLSLKLVRGNNIIPLLTKEKVTGTREYKKGMSKMCSTLPFLCDS